MLIDFGRVAGAATLFILTCGSVPAYGQTVSDVLSFLVTNRSVQTDDLDRDQAAAQATSETISRVVLVNLATLPVTSSSSAFVYRLNPDLGTEERATATFAPFLVERALTAGRGQASLGIAFQHLHFTEPGRQSAARRILGHDGQSIRGRERALRPRSARAQHRCQYRHDLRKSRHHRSCRNRPGTADGNAEP